MFSGLVRVLWIITRLSTTCLAPERAKYQENYSCTPDVIKDRTNYLGGAWFHPHCTYARALTLACLLASALSDSSVRYVGTSYLYSQDVWMTAYPSTY